MNQMNTSVHIPVITIDGPSGSGKGTISKWLANHLGWHFLDSGALYRLVALAAEKHQIALDDEARLVELAESLDVEFELDLGEGSEKGPGEERGIKLEGVDVSTEIRSEACAAIASKVAACEAVRSALLSRQRAFRQLPGLVADGRDMGTVVFQDAEIKVFLTASAEERAKRRYKQLNEKGISANLADLFQDIKARDERDAARKVAPLKPADKAYILDTTALGIEAVCREILVFVENHLPKHLNSEF